MTTSTYAILCYGFRLKNEDGEEEGIDLEWMEGEALFQDIVPKLYGLEEPDQRIDTKRFDNDQEYRKSWEDFWTKRDALMDEVGVDLVTHCHGEYPMYILAAKASVQNAGRGEPIELGQSVTVQAEWREKIRAFCEKVKIPFEEPQLILCSYWS